MKKSIKNIGFTLLGAASLALASSPLSRASIRGIPEYVHSSVSSILSDTPPQISSQQKSDNSKIDFSVAQHEIVTL
jgi:hypothetical protein